MLSQDTIGANRFQQSTFQRYNAQVLSRFLLLLFSVYHYIND